MAAKFWNTNQRKRPEEAEAHTYDKVMLIISSVASILLLSVGIGCCAYIGYCKSRPQKDQVGEKLKEIVSAILKVAVLNNKVEEVQELLQDYSEYNEIKDKNDKYPYQYAIDNGNIEILKLFSNYYSERKEEVEQTVRKFEGQVRKWDNRKDRASHAGTLINSLAVIIGAVNSFTARSKIDVLVDFVLNVANPGFHQAFGDILKNRLQIFENMAKVTERHFDDDLQKCKNLIGEAKHECIQDINNYLGQIQNQTSEVMEDLKRIGFDTKNPHKEGLRTMHLAKVEELKEFVQYDNMVYIALSVISAIMCSGSVGCSRYSERLCLKLEPQRELLKQVNKNLKEISSKILELKIEDRLNRKFNERLSGMEQRLAEIEMKLKASSNVENNDSQLDAAMREIRTNMEDVEVASAFASKSTKHRRSNERA